MEVNPKQYTAILVEINEINTTTTSRIILCSMYTKKNKGRMIDTPTTLTIFGHISQRKSLIENFTNEQSIYIRTICEINSRKK